MLRIISRNIQQAVLQRSAINSYAVTRSFCEKIENVKSEEKKMIDEEHERRLSGFAKAYEKFSNPTPEVEKVQEPNASFATLFRNSKFAELGDPENKIVVGKIFHVVDDDLYIDFGWKFHCVCTRPPKNSSAYVRGARVKLRVKDLELSSRFLGSAKDLTILEADCQLLGVISSPASPRVKTITT